MMRTVGVLTAALLLLGTVAAPAPAPAQARRAALGAGVGVAGGAVVTLSAIVARARFQQEYLDSADDLIHWQSIPMIAAPAAGVVFGLAGDDAQRGSIIGSSSGMLVGAGVGSLLGWLLSDLPEAPWAGGVMGAGVGMAVGGIAGGFLAWSQDEGAELEFPNILRFGMSVPAP